MNRNRQFFYLNLFESVVFKKKGGYFVYFILFKFVVRLIVGRNIFCLYFLVLFIFEFLFLVLQIFVLKGIIGVWVDDKLNN